MGLLIERVDNFMSTVTMIGDMKETDDDGDDVVVPLFSAYILSIDERDVSHQKPYNGCTPFDLMHRQAKMASMFEGPEMKDAEFLSNVSKGSLWGYAKDSEGSGVLRSSDEFLTKIRIPSFLARHGDLASPGSTITSKRRGNVYTKEMSRMFSRR